MDLFVMVNSSKRIEKALENRDNYEPTIKIVSDNTI